MDGQEKSLDKIRRGRPAIGRGVQVNAMLRPEIVEALDAAIAADPEATRPSRSELIRRIVAEWLRDRGLLGKD